MGALGPLLSMIQSDSESEIARFEGLETLCFMLMDPSNRRACLECGGLEAVLSQLSSSGSLHTRCSALEALATLSKGTEQDAVKVGALPTWAAQ